MAYTIPASSILEMQLRYTLDGQQLINVFHYRVDGPVLDGAGSLIAFAGDFDLKVARPLAGHQSNNVLNRAIRAQWVYPARYVPYDMPSFFTIGQVAASSESGGTAVSLKRLGDRANRKNRGRIYLGGVPETGCQISTLTNAYYNALNAEWAVACQASLDYAGEGRFADPVIWSYKRPIEFTVVESGSADRYVRYQRRREVGRGI